MPHVNHNVHFLGKANMRESCSLRRSPPLSRLHVQQRTKSSILLLEVKVNSVKNLTSERLNEICSGSISYSTIRQQL